MFAKKSLFLLCLTVFICGIAQSNCKRCIGLYGDTQANDPVHKEVVKQIVSHKPNVVFHMGDMVLDGFDPKEWRVFKSYTAPIRRVTKGHFYGVHGNHENHADKFLKYFNNPQTKEKWYWGKKINDIYFIVMDADSPFWQGSEQSDWILEQFKKAKLSKAKFTAVLIHRPLYSSCEWHLPGEARVMQILDRVFRRHKVDIVFHGHSHFYERSRKNGVNYVITGSGGAGLHKATRKNPYRRKLVRTHNFVLLSVNGKRLTVEAFNKENKLFDRFTIISKK
jgi:predicted phosphodiesterase